jgi:hypothetical protein
MKSARAAKPPQETGSGFAGFIEMLRSIRKRLADAAFVCGILSFPLWLLSYAWVPFRLAGADSEGVWAFVVGSEIGAMVFGLASIVAGIVAMRAAPKGSPAWRRARQGVILGVLAWVFLITFNVIGLLWS